MSKYHKSEGGLWPNQEKAKSNHPDKTGSVELTKEQIKGLIAMHKAGKTPKLKLAAWDRKAQAGEAVAVGPLALQDRSKPRQ